MSIDAYFCIGKQHQKEGVPCQDYALVSDQQFPVIVVSDGCSGAKARTDIGARMLALAFEAKASVLATTPSEFFQELLAHFKDIKVGSVRDNLATVVGGVILPDRFRFFMMGDGALVISYKDGSKTIFEWGWIQNAPLYLGYYLEQDGVDRFIRETAGENQALDSVLETRYALNARGEIISKHQQWHNVKAFWEGYQMDIPLKEVQTIACFSDGLFSFYKEDATVSNGFAQLEAVSAAREFTGFKNYVGQFVTRRAVRGLQAQAKEGFINYDDLAIAAWSAE